MNSDLPDHTDRYELDEDREERMSIIYRVRGRDPLIRRVAPAPSVKTNTLPLSIRISPNMPREVTLTVAAPPKLKLITARTNRRAVSPQVITTKNYDDQNRPQPDIRIASFRAPKCRFAAALSIALQWDEAVEKWCRSASFEEQKAIVDLKYFRCHTVDLPFSKAAFTQAYVRLSHPGKHLEAMERFGTAFRVKIDGHWNECRLMSSEKPPHTIPKWYNYERLVSRPCQCTVCHRNRRNIRPAQKTRTVLETTDHKTLPETPESPEATPTDHRPRRASC